MSQTYAAKAKEAIKTAPAGNTPAVPAKPTEIQSASAPSTKIDVTSDKVSIAPPDFKQQVNNTAAVEASTPEKEKKESEGQKLSREVRKEVSQVEHFCAKTFGNFRKGAQDAWKKRDWRAITTVFVDVLVVSGVGFFAYEKRSQSWNKPVVCAVATGLTAFYGLQAYLFSAKKH